MKSLFELKKLRAFFIAAITAVTCVAGITAELPYSDEYVAYAENCGNEFVVISTSKSATTTATETNYNDFEYEVEDDGSITIIDYTGSASYVEIPESIDGKYVKKIGSAAFADNQTIQNVVLPDTIVEIGYKAFSTCKNLETINFPDSLKTIDKYAFTTCHSLKEIDLNQVENIGDCTFQLCISVNEIIVPGSIQNVPDHAFHGCSGVETLIFEEGVTSIESTAALNMYSISNIYIPESVTEIGDHALGYSYYSPDYTRINATIYGYRDTAAEKYAAENGFDFVALGNMLGDVDRNGIVDVVDATFVLQQYSYASMGSEGILDEEQINIGNVDGNTNPDGTPLLDVVDATHILRYYSYKSMDDAFTWEELFAV